MLETDRLALTDARASAHFSRRRGFEPLFVIACLFVAATIRFSTSHYSPWYDELASVFFASQPVHRLWGAWMLRETNPPLYYTILKFWMGAFGTGVSSLRFPSILASLAVIAVTFKGVSDRFGTKAGIISAALLTLSAQQLFFAHEIRSYIFLYLAISISFFGLLQIIEEGTPSVSGWIYYVAGSTGAIYFHTTGFIWPAAATLALIAVDRRFLPGFGDRWLNLLLADIAILIGVGWWLYITVQQLHAATSNIAWIDRPSPSAIPSLLLSSIVLTRHPAMLLKALPLGLSLLAALGAVRRWHLPETRLTIACFAFSLLFFVLLSIRQPILIDRTLLWLGIFPVVLISIGLEDLKGRWFSGVTAVVVAGLSLNLVDQARRLKVEDWTTAASTMARTPEAVLVVDSESMDIAMNMACLIELHLKMCPFPIVVLDRPGDARDSWGRGGLESLAFLPLKPEALPNGAQVYLMRRIYHDVLKDLENIRVLSEGGSTPPFAGPYPSSLLTNIEMHGTWDGPFLRIDRTVPLN